MENISLTNELARAKDNAERVLLRHYYKYGSVLVGLGLLQEAKRRKLITEDGCDSIKRTEDQLGDDLSTISRLSGGMATVIVPVVRNLAATAAKLVS
jgi:hypothetical protein